ncbi:MAG: ABC transporter permease [Gammaproteobacteria bacterium]|jgi:ABC-2 type transport system permease protein
MDNFSIQRLFAVIIKEFIQIKRDRPTLAMMVLLPLVQLVLFGYAINSNPKDLPTAIVVSDNSVISMDFVAALQNSEYFKIVEPNTTINHADKLLRRGEIIFAVHIPVDFMRNIVRGGRPSLLVEVDATDPAASGNAIAALSQLANSSIMPALQGSLHYLQPTQSAFELRVHQRYNPGLITSYNIVPGLLGVVLTMSMVVITSQAMTRERERGTLENLLSTPVRPLEVIIGKIIPFIVIGYTQVIIILALAYFFFHVPMQGSVILLLILCLPFIAANLSVGITFSTLAKNQLQAMQSSIFFFLPSLLLSGFMFPFAGMPAWAQAIGNMLPLTHFLVIVRGILLKGNGFFDVIYALIPILLFMIVMVYIALKRFRQTLD